MSDAVTLKGTLQPGDYITLEGPIQVVAVRNNSLSPVDVACDGKEQR